MIDLDERWVELYCLVSVSKRSTIAVNRPNNVAERVLVSIEEYHERRPRGKRTGIPYPSLLMNAKALLP